MRRLVSGLLLVVAAGSAHADRWSVPTDPNVKASGDGRYLIRVMPADPIGAGGHAIAEWHLFNGTSYDKIGSAPLVNRGAPVEVAIFNRGELVTLDNWGGLGSGAVVVLYSPPGRGHRSIRSQGPVLGERRQEVPGVDQFDSLAMRDCAGMDA